MNLTDTETLKDILFECPLGLQDEVSKFFFAASFFKVALYSPTTLKCKFSRVVGDGDGQP
jgi:hypothetical protein